MAVKKYQALQPEAMGSIFLETKLPLDRPVANYYRQSTDEQVGNISTIIQTVDMPVYLQRLGWSPDKIRMIDMDEGVSGTTKIDEREGMRLLFDLITSDQLGAVACQDEDRLFRDVTQIQVNIFIEACRAHNVLVITPGMIYDFAHSHHGSFHARQFRFKSEMAADYIKTVILGKLHAAQRNIKMSGRWSNTPMPVGFMVDMRKMLLGGVINEQYRRFVVFEPYAAVVREYFRMFLANSGNVNKTLIQIWEHGPYFPDPHICKPPDGHKIYYKIRRNDYGWCFKDKPTLVQMLSNASYIGHWIVKNTVVRWHNHPCIVDEDIFYRAFNYLSSIGLDGTCNTHYRPRRSYTRPVQEEAREEERPLCSGLMVSPWENEWKSVGTHWDSIDEHYNYVLCGSDPLATSIWHKKATYVDKSIGLLLLEKLRLTFNFDQWSGALDKFIIDYEQHKQLKRRQLKHLETVMNNLTTSLESISTPGLIAQVEQRYQDAQLEHQRLLDEINTQPPALVNAEKMKALKVSYHHILENWETMTMDEKREIFHVFITKIEILYDKDRVLTFHIYWQDGSTDTMTIRRIASTGVAWLPHEHDLLVQLADGGAGQLEIAKAFPKRRWIAIARKYTTLTGKKLKWVARGNPIRKEETYEDYLRQCTGKEPPNTNVEGSA